MRSSSQRKYRLSKLLGGATVTCTASVFPERRLHAARAAPLCAILRFRSDSNGASSIFCLRNRTALKLITPVQRDDAAAQIVIGAIVETGVAQHAEQRFLIGKAP